MSSEKSGLFRPEALARRRNQFVGAVIIQNAVSTGILSIIGLLLTFGALSILVFGSYTKRVSVKGQLVPEHGLSQIVSPSVGIVLSRARLVDQHVAAGDVLYTISTELAQNNQASVQARIIQEADSRKISLRMELEKLRQLQVEEQGASERKLAGLYREFSNLTEQEAIQAKRLDIAKETLQRYKSIGEGTFFSVSQLQQKEEELLDQEMRLNAVRRDKLSLQRDINMQDSEVSALRLRHVAQIEQMNRSISNAGQELVESESKRSFAIVSPLSGTLVSATAEVGQAVDTAKPLAAVVPDDATLVAQIYAPSRSVGLLRTGGHVLMRYHSFPYEVFGVAHGEILSISRIALAPNEFSSIGGYIGDPGRPAEPMYKVIVALEKQSILSQGEQVQLRAGMLLDADLVLETRPLYQWMLAPLFRIAARN